MHAPKEQKLKVMEEENAPKVQKLKVIEEENALKGQKLLAQGNALGNMQARMSP